MLAAQVFHGDVSQAAILAGVVNGDDSRMIQPAGHFGFPKESGACIGEIVFGELLR
jgi:hypothetical protein